MLGSVFTIALGRVLGMVELFVLGAVGLACTVAALAVVHNTRARLDVARRVVPARVHAGDAARVELRARNVGRRRTPVLELRDPVGDTRGATVTLASLSAGAAAQAAYRLPTSGRGVVDVGPLTITATDPLHLARSTAVGADALALTVLPRIHAIDLGGDAGAFRRTGRGSHDAFGPTGEEFSALRPYVPGDDLRRVHWLASARHDDLIVRQDQPPRDAELVVLLDRRSATHTPESFETAVSVVASIVAAAGGRRGRLVLRDTAGSSPTDATTDDQRAALLDLLALVDTTAGGSLRRALGDVDHRRERGSLVIVMGRATATDLEAISVVAPAFDDTTVVVTRPDLTSASSAGVAVLALTDDSQLPAAWSTRAMSRART